VSSEIEWRWADPSGQQRLVREDELRAALASGMIPPNAPVWRHGWKEWQPAYAVPELTTSTLAAANGVVPNIPPPPLGVLDAQKTFEKKGESLVSGVMRPPQRTEPPMPPRYVPAATRVPTAPKAPSVNAAENPTEAKKGAEGSKKENLPTTIGIPALPQTLPQTGAAALASALTPGRAPTGPSSGAPPPVRVTSKPPPAPPAVKRKKSATLIMYGGAPQTTPPASEGQEAPPINVPGPGGNSPQAITRPPPGDGTAKVSAPPVAPEPEENIEELSSSMLLEDRESGNESVVLSDSVREVSSSAPPSPIKKAGGASGTLLGFPSPTAPKVPDIPVPGSRADDTGPRRAQDSPGEVAGVASSRVLPDLRALMDRSRLKWIWPVVGGGGAVAFVGLLGILIGAMRSGNAEESPKPPPTTAPTPLSIDTVPKPALSPPTTAGGNAGATCSASGASHTLSPHALVPTGVEVERSGNTIGLGFALGPKDAVAIEVDAATLTPSVPVKSRSLEPLKRVVPDSLSGKLAALGEADRKADRLQGRRSVPGTALDVGVDGGALAWASHGRSDATTKLWPLDGDAPVEALRGVPIEVKGEHGIAIAFRRAGAIWMGAAVGERPAPKGALFRVEALGPVVGSPTIASAGDAILVAWADRAAETDAWGLRWTKLTPGEPPRDPVAFHAPSGGLGEHAMSPWLAKVANDRVLLVWTEGPVSRHQVRAQTLATDGALVGDAFTVSSEGANAGQAQAAILPDGRGVVAFLAANGKNYEVVATPIACVAK
jgi:hypothetical protein